VSVLQSHLKVARAEIERLRKNNAQEAAEWLKANAVL
jgi:uncharacterized small protein (DUF1192 family)